MNPRKRKVMKLRAAAADSVVEVEASAPKLKTEKAPIKEVEVEVKEAPTQKRVKKVKTKKASS